jgi:hypothetical protein
MFVNSMQAELTDVSSELAQPPPPPSTDMYLYIVQQKIPSFSPSMALPSLGKQKSGGGGGAVLQIILK